MCKLVAHTHVFSLHGDITICIVSVSLTFMFFLHNQFGFDEDE